MNRILHLVPGAPFGGAQRLAIDLAANQRRAGLDAQLLLLNPSVQTQAAAKLADVPVQSAGSGPARIWRTGKLVRKADVLHLHMPPPWLGPILPGAPAKLMHLHVRPPDLVHKPGLKRSLDTWGGRKILEKMDRTIAISDWVAGAWRGEFADVLPPVSVIYNGIAIPQPTQRPGGAFTIAVACRLSDRKGMEEFIDLARVLHLQDPEMQFLIAGDGPDRAQYEKSARDVGLGDAMHFEGFVEDMHAFWSRAHLAAFTPPFEPFGLRLIEPVGHGVPVLAYLTQSGSDEVVKHCRGVSAVPYGQVEALAKIALRFRDDRELLARTGSEGREDVQSHFALETMAEQVHQAYQSVIADRKGGSA